MSKKFSPRIKTPFLIEDQFMKINFQTSTVKFTTPCLTNSHRILTPQEKLLKQQEASKHFLSGSILVAMAGVTGCLSIALGVIGITSIYEGISTAPVYEIYLPILLPAIILTCFTLLLGWIALKKQSIISKNLSEIISSDTELIRKHFFQRDPNSLTNWEFDRFIYKKILTGNKNRSYQLSLLKHIQTNFSKENSNPLSKKIANQIQEVMEHLNPRQKPKDNT